MALAWGVLLAGLLQLLFLLPFLRVAGLLPVPKVDFRDSGVKRILWLMVPRHLWGFGRPDQFIAGYGSGVISRDRQPFLAVLFRPFTGVAAGAVWYHDRHSDSAEPVEGACWRLAHRLFSHPRLGNTNGLSGGHSSLSGPGGALGKFDHNLVLSG